MISSCQEAHPALFGLSYCQVPHAHQIIGRCGERKDPLHPTSAAVTELAKARHRLDPTEDLFYPFALALAHGVAIMAGCSPIDG